MIARPGLVMALIAFAMLCLLAIRQREHPLLVDAAFHRASGEWCDVTPQSQSEPLERPRGIINGRPASGDTV